MLQIGDLVYFKFIVDYPIDYRLITRANNKTGNIEVSPLGGNDYNATPFISHYQNYELVSDIFRDEI